VAADIQNGHYGDVVSSRARQDTADLLSAVAVGLGLREEKRAFDGILRELHERILGEPAAPTVSPLRHVLLLMTKDPKTVARIRSGDGLSRSQRNSLANLADGYNPPIPAVALVDRISEELVAAFQRGFTSTSHDPIAAAVRNEAALAALVEAVKGDWQDRVEIRTTGDEVSFISRGGLHKHSRVRVAAYADQYEFQLYHGEEHVITVTDDQAVGQATLRGLLPKLDGSTATSGP
jgi:hypothetical protein